MVVSTAFLGAYAVDLDVGVTDLSLSLASIKQAMARAARQVVLLVDSSKWGTAAFAKVLALSSVKTVVTDTDLPSAARLAMERIGIDVILA